jgi:REP element-mobilizing transposase RayT
MPARSRRSQGDMANSQSRPSSCWHSRGYIPHFDNPGLVQSITFRLADAVPESLVKQWKTELAWAQNLPATDPRQVALRKRIEKYEDAGHGACWLRDDSVAEFVERALLHFDGERYRMIAWCIMPNHVHAIIETRDGWALPGVVHSWKSFTSHEANKLLDRSGRLGFREYHDRYIRDEEHLANVVEYVENNPVSAGLVRVKEDWKWSSAARRGPSK